MGILASSSSISLIECLSLAASESMVISLASMTLRSTNVTTMEYDPLRDEGILYAMAMMGDGVQVELHSYPGTFHGSAMMSHADVSKRDSADSMRALRRGLALPEEPPTTGTG